MDPNLTQTPPAQTPQASTPNEIEETKKVSSKLLILIFILIAIMIPTGLFLYSKHKSSVTYTAKLAPTPVANSTPTPNPTANWQSYQSSGFANDFSVKYPLNFGVSRTNGSVVLGPITNGARLLVGTSLSSNLTGSDIAIKFSEIPSSTDLTDNSQALANALAASPTNVDFTATQVGGLSGVSLSNSNFYTIGVYRSGVIFEISGKSGPGGVDALTQLFPTLLSTFKFTDQNSSGWKTFENKNFDFTFNYPSSSTISSNGPNETNVNLDNKFDIIEITQQKGSTPSGQQPNFQNSNGVSGYRESLPKEQNPAQENLYVYRDGNLYIFGLSYSDPSTVDIYNKIIDTIRFNN